MKTNNILISKVSKAQLDEYINNPKISLLIYAPKWIAKYSLAKYLAANILKININKINQFPYLKIINLKDKIIGIDQAKEIINFMKLEVPLDQKINRIVIINNAQNMTLEAQNSLLKSIEECPNQSLYILTCNDLSKLLSTIKSRLFLIKIKKPSEKKIKIYYQDKNIPAEELDQLIKISNNYPILLKKMLSKKESKEKQALTLAKEILTSGSFERMLLVDKLTKDKELLKLTCQMIKQMCLYGIKSSDLKRAQKWQNILSKTLELEYNLSLNVNLKIILLDYLVNLEG